jgi:hypothetical protein
MRRFASGCVSLVMGLGLLLSSQVAPVTALTDYEVNLRTVMTGAAVHPGPGHPDVTVAANASALPSAGQLVYWYTISGLGQVTAIHLHSGAAGQTGPLLFALEIHPDGEEVVGSRKPVDPDLLQDMVDNPAGYYLEVHTATFPNGAVRGQFERGPTWLNAWARGVDVVPGPGDPNTEGRGTVRLDPQAGQACASLGEGLSAIPSPTGASIHHGQPGEVGAPLLDLPTPVSGTTACATGYDAGVLQAIVEDPASHYLVIDTAAFPDGAVRGQLSHYAVGPPPEACPAQAGVECVLPVGTYVFDGLATALTYTTSIELLALQTAWAEAGEPVPGLGALRLDDPGNGGVLNLFVFDGQVPSEPCDWAYESIGTDPTDLIRWLRLHPLLEVTEPRSVDYGGVPGLEVDVRVGASTCVLPEIALLDFRPGLDESVREDTTLRVVAQRVGTQTILTVTRDFTAFQLEGSRIAGIASNFTDVAQEVVESFVWDVAAAPGSPPALPDTAVPVGP